MSPGQHDLRTRMMCINETETVLLKSILGRRHGA